MKKKLIAAGITFLILITIIVVSCSNTSDDKISEESLNYIGTSPEGCKIYSLNSGSSGVYYEALVIICPTNYNSSTSQH